TLDRGGAAHPAALDPGWQPITARRSARHHGDPTDLARTAAGPGDGDEPAHSSSPHREPAALSWRRVRLTHRRTGRVHELVGVALQLGDLEAIGAVRAVDWPADAHALGMLQLDIEAGRSDDELVTRLAESFVTTGAGAAFDVSSLLPEAAEALLDRAAAGLADHLAAAAEPFLNAAQWAALANRELAAGGAEGTPEWPFALRGSAETALAHRIELLLHAGDLDGAVTVARRARTLGLAVLTSAAGATARAANPVKVALDTLALARELGIDPDLDRAQELVYDTVRTTDRPDLAPLAEGLGLSLALFEGMSETIIRTSA
ncbi:MAG: hypothetical protein LC792_24540, partial [Actinobacteria bacterium]|nr:hypothetical protein [Actinomycetota bacterium]